MGNQVQDQIASGILDQFHVSIGMNLQTKLQDWQGRQTIQYGAEKSLINKDFHGLSDFNFEMGLYSATHHTLRFAWRVIKSIVPNNPKTLATLITVPGFGQVGRQMLSLVGLSNILVAPQDILKNRNQFNSTITSVR